MKDMNKTNAAELARNFRQRLRSIISADYEAFKTIVNAWSNEPEKNFLPRLTLVIQEIFP